MHVISPLGGEDDIEVLVHHISVRAQKEQVIALLHRGETSTGDGHRTGPLEALDGRTHCCLQLEHLYKDKHDREGQPKLRTSVEGDGGKKNSTIAATTVITYLRGGVILRVNRLCVLDHGQWHQSTEGIDGLLKLVQSDETDRSRGR